MQDQVLYNKVCIVQCNAALEASSVYSRLLAGLLSYGQPLGKDRTQGLSDARCLAVLDEWFRKESVPAPLRNVEGVERVAIVVLEEIDLLARGGHEVLYNLLDWS